MVSIIGNKAHWRKGQKHALEQCPGKPQTWWHKKKNCLLYSNKWFCINMYLQRKLHNHKNIIISLYTSSAKAVFRYHRIYVFELEDWITWYWKRHVELHVWTSWLECSPTICYKFVLSQESSKCSNKTVFSLVALFYQPWIINWSKSYIR